MPETMQAVVLDEFGGPETLASIRDVPVPAPEPDEVLVRTRRCSVCYLDAIVRSGVRPGVELPRILGHEIAGEIIELGAHVRGWSRGERVTCTHRAVCGHCWYCRAERSTFCVNMQGIGVNRDGGYAEYTTLPASSLARIPENVSDEAASIAGCVLGAVYKGIVGKARVHAGETVLITGAGGGAGIHGVQIAAVSGARVLAVTTSPHKTNLIEQAGADEVLTGSEAEVLEQVRELNHGRGADVVIDNVGQATSGLSLRALDRGGRLVFVGELSTAPAKVSIARLLYRETEIHGVASPAPGELNALLEMIDQGKITPMISQSLPLDQAAEAHRSLENRANIGKIALRAGTEK
jgi:D-arabinose 1-dehydrogenase-like Zn-dependent alcohol dehydrogenase